MPTHSKRGNRSKSRSWEGVFRRSRQAVVQVIMSFLWYKAWIWSRWTLRPLINRNKKVKRCHKRTSRVSYRSTRKERTARWSYHRISSSCRKWFKRIQLLYKHSNLKIVGRLNQVKYRCCQIQLNLACCQLFSMWTTQGAQIGCVKLYTELLERISRINILLWQILV